MPDDDFFDDEAAGFGEPVHPDDRLWRHPSELHKVPPPGARSIPDTVDFAPLPRRRRSWTALAASGAVGAAVAVSFVLAVGVGERVVTRWVEPPEMFPFFRGAVATASTTTPAALDTTTEPVPPHPQASEAAESAAPSLVWISAVSPDRSTDCAGVVITDEGHVLTEARPFEDVTSITVRFHDGTTAPGELVGIDPLTELAVLRVDRPDLRPAQLGDPRQLKVGGRVLLLGPDETGRTMASTAMINAVGTTARLDTLTLYDLIRFEAPVPASHSGGPLLNDAGEVVGVTVRAGSGDPFGFATPIDAARTVALDLIEEGRARHPWLGIEGRQEKAQPVVLRVIEDSPAHLAGLQPDDVILAVDGEPVPSMAAFVTAVRARRPGDLMAITYRRDGVDHECVVVLGLRDPAVTDPPDAAEPGHPATPGAPGDPAAPGDEGGGGDGPVEGDTPEGGTAEPGGTLEPATAR